MKADESLVASDLHFSRKPQDEFMWNLFKFLERTLASRHITRLLILGDITEAKSGFDADFINRVVDGFARLAQFADIDILSGNHDGISASRPFLQFLDHIPRIRFITQPFEKEVTGKPYKREVWLPHSRQPQEDWARFNLQDALCFAHITVNQAHSETNQLLHGGIDADFFKDAKLTLAGDVHTPGKVGPVEYIGSPYATKMFAHNEHKYRCLILNHDTLETEDVYYDFPKRLTVDVKTNAEFVEQVNNLLPGDQVKIRFHVDHSNLASWKPVASEIRQTATQSGLQLVGFGIVKEFNDTHETTLSNSKNEYLDFGGYCRVNNIDTDLARFGEQILQEASA